MQDCVNELPQAHYACLQFLMFHLCRVIQHANVNFVSHFLHCYFYHSNINQMSVTNLAVVFAPTLMRPSDPARELTDMKYQQQVIVGLLENYSTIFDDAVPPGNTGHGGNSGNPVTPGIAGNANNNNNKI